MSDPTVALTKENLDRLQRIGHLHCSTDEQGTIVTLELEDSG